MVTATAGPNRRRRQPATAPGARTIRASFGYVRPEKQKIGTASLLPLAGPQAQGWTGKYRAALSVFG